MSFFLEAPPRFELGVKVLQTSALPLGYGALFHYMKLFEKMNPKSLFIKKTCL